MKVSFEFPEGATPLNDCSGLKPFWVTSISDLNRVEAENILKAQTRFLSGNIDHPKNWYNVPFLKKVHTFMFADVWDWAGEYRKSVTSVGIPPVLIPSKMAEHCHEMIVELEKLQKISNVEMTARVHHRLVSIHPFENGNGRFSRLIADRFLKSIGGKIPNWPAYLNKEGIVRKDYINTLKNADKGDFEPLIDLMKKLGARP